MLQYILSSNPKLRALTVKHAPVLVIVWFSFLGLSGHWLYHLKSEHLPEANELKWVDISLISVDEAKRRKARRANRTRVYTKEFEDPLIYSRGAGEYEMVSSILLDMPGGLSFAVWEKEYSGDEYALDYSNEIYGVMLSGNVIRTPDQIIAHKVLSRKNAGRFFMILGASSVGLGIFALALGRYLRRRRT